MYMCAGGTVRRRTPVIIRYIIYHICNKSYNFVGYWVSSVIYAGELIKLSTFPDPENPLL
jgi:hypothetical protein